MHGVNNLEFVCRICKQTSKETLIDFEDMALTGVFLEPSRKAQIEPLSLVRCESCGLVQLEKSYDLNVLYGETYGYESHLNSSMKSHLQNTAKNIEKKYLKPKLKQRVVDIASNDGTLLAGYENKELERIGIDPLIDVVSDFYPDGAVKIPSFFSKDAYFSEFSEPADLVTSLSVLYDLDDPISFAKDINSILKDEGIWYFEQSYLPTMVKTLGYDTVCHEHLLYLTLKDIERILSDSGFQIIEVSLNEINGGSIAVSAKKTLERLEMPPFGRHLQRLEERDGYEAGGILRDFAKRAIQHKSELLELVNDYLKQGYEIFGLGASTKGNVLLQWLQLTGKEMGSIGEVNPKKFGKLTPGSGIPIVDESTLIDNLGSKTLMLVLPWHFRSGIVNKTANYRSNGGLLLFPLPTIEIVN